MMSSATQFVFSQEGNVLARFALEAGEYVIGSAEECQVVIDMDGMLPRHALLHIGEDGVRVEDLQTEDGTFVAGTRLRQAVRLNGDAPVTFGRCSGELRMESPVGPERSLRTRRKRKPRRLPPQDPGWEIWLPQAASPAPAAAKAEPPPQLAALEAELIKLQEENAALVEADRAARLATQENMSLLKVANRALVKKLSKATAPSDERETLRRELKQREKALVEAWAGRQAADERISALGRQVAELEAGRGEAPAAVPLLFLPAWLFWAALAGCMGLALLGFLLRQSSLRAGRAEAIVQKVRATAPQFLAESRALAAEGDFQPALGKIDCALALDPGRPEYFFQRGALCESLLLMEPAIAAFESVVALHPGDPAARQNLELCQSIKKSRSGAEAPESQYALHRIMLDEGRLPEALCMARRLPDDRELLRLTWQTILANAGLHAELVLNSEGTFDLSLDAQSQVDLALLHGLPLRRLGLARSGISDLLPLHGTGLRELDLSGNPVRDLSPLNGLPLEKLNLADTEITNLFPLSGMPLRELRLDRTPVSDLSPLRGARLARLSAAGTIVWNLQPLAESPLRALDLAHSRVSDLTPLHLLPLAELNLEGTNVLDLKPLEGVPLTVLNLSRTGIRTVEPLRKAPLRELWLGGCARLESIDSLGEQMSLEKLTLPPQCKKLEALRPLPSLRFLAYDVEGQSVAALQTATEFWRGLGN